MVGTREAKAAATESGGAVATESGGALATESGGAATTGDETVAPAGDEMPANGEVMYAFLEPLRHHSAGRIEPSFRRPLAPMGMSCNKP